MCIDIVCYTDAAHFIRDKKNLFFFDELQGAKCKQRAVKETNTAIWTNM